MFAFNGYTRPFATRYYLTMFSINYVGNQFLDVVETIKFTVTCILIIETCMSVDSMLTACDMWTSKRTVY